ncbi:hypothetical protein [Pseudomonas sp. ES3-33]|uniref:hypothetical protein n=1 Tax=Pseudomonas sp. ES3-33 TaxID=1628833 RepID=UPI0006990CBA|nr:hypothetical protein [Pseudomonas sp. ES3-33]
MSDHSELKKLAEAAPEGPWFGPEYAPGTSYVFDVDLGTLLAYESIDSEKDACLRYVAAANPAAVLALIAEIQLIRSGDLFAAGVKHSDEAAQKYIDEHWRPQRDQLKAENEALRKDAERYRRMRTAALKQADVLADEFDAEFDLQLDAAIGKEAQS